MIFGEEEGVKVVEKLVRVVLRRSSGDVEGFKGWREEGELLHGLELERERESGKGMRVRERAGGGLVGVGLGLTCGPERR